MVASDLEKLTQEMLDNYGSGNYKALLAGMSKDMQGIDEISRRWLRSDEDVAQYFEGVSEAVSNVSSRMYDVRSIVKGDIGIVTCMVDQSYLLNGKQVTMTAPTTVIFERVGGEWKALLVHTLPLAEES